MHGCIQGLGLKRNKTKELWLSEAVYEGFVIKFCEFSFSFFLQFFSRGLLRFDTAFGSWRASSTGPFET